ncbi:phage tail assembly chaperone G [Bacillus smithii]|uniref:phage tail assembly chaperone G n=1 Tax=Bacillus smithii TaxID=1479 RepID=UPI003D25EEE3
MLKIELRNPQTGEIETYTETFVSAKSLRKVVEFGMRAEKGEMNELEQLDELVALVASLFKDERVTFDSILEGIEASKIGEVLNEIITQVMGGEAPKQQTENQK